MGDSYILITVSVLASVSSSYGSQDQVITTSFGKTATLQCPIANQGSDLRSLYWKKDGTAIYSLSSNGVHTSGKYSVTDTASLVIPDVTESDGGNYSCIVVFWKISGTEESDVMQLYVIGVYVSHCIDTGQEVDGCSCYINGSNITSVECSASGFPHPPDITWEEEDPVIYQSSSINLTRFRENTTLTCKAKDGNLKSAVENKIVCVYYEREVTSTGGSPVEATTASVKVRAFVAAIVVLSIVLIFVLLKWLKGVLEAVYKRKKGKAFHLPTFIMCTSRWSAETGDLGDPEAAFDLDERDRDECEILIPKLEFQEVTYESQIPTYQGNRVIQPSIPMAAMSSSNMEAFNLWPFFLRGGLQSSVRAARINATSRIIQDGLVTWHSGLRGNSLFNCSTDMLPSLLLQSNMTPSMASSMVAYNPLSPVLLWELQSSDMSERAAMSHTFSPIFLGFGLERGYSGLMGYICLNCSTVTWTSSVSDSVEQTRQEEDEIQDPLSTDRLLEDKCGDSEESDNEHHDYMNT